MTERKITYALKKISTCKHDGYLCEALLNSYHLNVELIRYMLSSTDSSYSSKDKKIKAIVHEFLEQIANNPGLKAIINKKNLKIVKPWLNKMDAFFKKLKLEPPSNVKELLLETEKIFGILNISVVKLLVKNKN